jgi:hypothetical protein
MNRRSFLETTLKSSISEGTGSINLSDQPSPAPGSLSGTFRTLSGIDPYSGPWGKSQVIHLLRRTTFAAKKADIEKLSAMSPDAAVDLLLQEPVDTPPPPVNHYNTDTYTDPTGVLPGETWIGAPWGDGMVDLKRVESLKCWWTGLMINQAPNLLEKMTLFWHNHFAVKANSIDNARYAYYHNILLRQYAFGNFKELIRKVTTDPAMLRYLNGFANVNTAPDENYARELQELFTLGKGSDSRYTEQDVKTAARVLTGWKIDSASQTSYFDPAMHDTGDKIFSEFYGNKVITGKTGQEGAGELDELLDMIFSQEEVSRFICRKLYSWFVYYQIDQTTEENIIAPLAALFREQNYEIKPVLSALFKSTHFFDPLNVGCMIKNPVDFMMGMARQFYIRFPDSVSYRDQYITWDYIRMQASEMQMDIAEPPNVAGWPAYWQAPLFHRIWVNSVTLPRRVRVGNVFIAPNGYQRLGTTIKIEPLEVAELFSDPSDPDLLISELTEYLYAIPVSDNQKSELKELLLMGQDTIYWSDAWNGYKANPADEHHREFLENSLRSLLKYMMELPEFQLC